jgi:hypothetical protein
VDSKICPSWQFSDARRNISVDFANALQLACTCAVESGERTADLQHCSERRTALAVHGKISSMRLINGWAKMVGRRIVVH